MKQRVLFGACAAWLWACGNGPAVTEEEVPGKYVLSFRDVTDSLELESGGKYWHRTWKGSARIIQEVGDWSFATKDNEPAVEFSKFSVVDEGTSLSRPSRGWWIPPLGRDRNGNLTLLVTRDIGLRYTKSR